MTLKETLARLKALGNERMRAQNSKRGAGDNQFGVLLGDIRKLAQEIKTDHELALALWETGNIDARLLATLLIKPKNLSAEEMDRMVRSASFVQVAEWLNSYVVRNHPEKETLRQGWMAADDPWAARAGWSLTSERIGKSPQGLDLPAILDRIESEMRDAAPEAQWTMNFCLAGIASISRSIASAPSPSEKLWEFIVTTPFPRDAPHPSHPFGSTKWSVDKVERSLWRSPRRGDAQVVGRPARRPTPGRLRRGRWARVARHTSSVAPLAARHSSPEANPR